MLLVEDELVSREMVLTLIGGLFKAVFVAADGDQGFELFCRHQPDVVLTDQVMLGLSGLGLMQKIRATGAKTPVVLMTSSLDNELLLEAINSGVERFVPKPLNFDFLHRTLKSIAREIVTARLWEQQREQEVELLRYRDAYNSMQQESALSKERHVVHNDLLGRVLKGAGGVRWGVDVFFCPRDIMCGDGYSVRTLFDGRQIIYLGDAMGSGMSASLTAMLTTSFCNYQLEYVHLWKSFSLRIFLQRFQEYLSCVLLEDEVLSCGFLLVDLVKEQVETALFALPPLLVRGGDGAVTMVRGQNPPLGVYPSQMNIGTLSLSGVTDLLIMTDGVTDAELGYCLSCSDSAFCLNSGSHLEGVGTYRDMIQADFRGAPTVASLVRRFAGRTCNADLDDLTLMHLRRLDCKSAWNWMGEPELSLVGLSRTIVRFLEALSLATPLDDVERDEVEVILTEALTNALEHGSLGIDRAEKARLLLSGAYDDALENRSPLPGASIALLATLWLGAEKPLLLMEVRDNGPGVPIEALCAEADKAGVNGRGFQMISRFSDALFSEGPGGRLIILKTLEKGAAYET